MRCMLELFEEASRIARKPYKAASVAQPASCATFLTAQANTRRDEVQQCGQACALLNCCYLEEQAALECSLKWTRLQAEWQPFGQVKTDDIHLQRSACLRRNMINMITCKHFQAMHSMWNRATCCNARQLFHSTVWVQSICKLWATLQHRCDHLQVR